MFRAFAISEHQASVRSRSSACSDFVVASSQVSQVCPNNPACRSRCFPSAVLQIWVAAGFPYGGPAMVRHPSVFAA